MVRFEEMTVGRRRVRGSISDLVDLDLRGVHHVAIAFGEDWRDDPALTAGLEPYRDFLELPMAEGVAPLVAARNGVFAYRAPVGRTARELIGVWAEEGGGGIRAALELLVEGTLAIADAARAGADRGLRSHGSLDPWRILVDERGKVVLLGYGLPPLDVLDFQRDEKSVPPADTLRYCPPERLDGDPEDWTSDVFALALAAIELLTGRPVYDGRPSQILEQASTGEAVKRLDGVAKELVAVVRTSLALHPDQRPTDPMILVDAARKAAARAPGRTLAELVGGARPYLSDVEDDLPPGFSIVDLAGPPPDEPQRKAAIDAATESSGRAAAVVEALGARIDAAAEQVDDALPGVAAALDTARQALERARSAAERADRAADEALSSLDAAEAQAAAARAEAAVEDVATAHHAIDDALAQARQLTDEAARADAERRDNAIATARAAVERAEAALATVPVGAEEVQQQVDEARANGRKAEASRDPGAAERAAERAVACAEAAEAAAKVAIENNRQAVERVHAARASLQRAEASLAQVPAADVREAVEQCRAEVTAAATDPDAVDRARVCADEAEQRAQAAAGHRELIRRRAWIAVARADAAGRGGPARAAAEVAEAALDLDEVMEAALRAESAADEAEAASKLDGERRGAARSRLAAARDRIAAAGAQWHPDGVASDLEAVEQAGAEIESTALGEDALAAAERAEQAAEAAVARARSAIRILTVIRRRAASTLREAEAEADHDSALPHLEATRAAVAAANATWDPDEADAQATAAENALTQLRITVERLRRSATARDRVRSVAEQVAELADKVGPDGVGQLDLARAAVAEADRAEDPADLEAAAERAELALRAATRSAEERAAHEAELAACYERGEQAVARALDLVGKVDEVLLNEVRAVVEELWRARALDLARALAERAERALALAEAAALERAERERAVTAQRERAKRAVLRAVDLMDRIDAEDVRYVEAARAALAEIDHATDLAGATASAERAEQAATAMQAAADRRSAREAELARLRAVGAEQVSVVQIPENPHPELQVAAARVRAGQRALDAARDLAAAEASLAEIDRALASWREVLASWNEARGRKLAEARSRAETALGNLQQVVADRDDLSGLLAEGRAAADRAERTEDADEATAAATALEALVTGAYGRIEAQRALELARERVRAALGRAEVAITDAGALLSLDELLLDVLSAAKEAEDATDPELAREAAERADAATAALVDAVEGARAAQHKAHVDAAEALERTRRAVDAHPMVGEGLVESATLERQAAESAHDAATAVAAATRALAIADQAEAALATARENDLQAVLLGHRDAVEAHAREAARVLSRVPYLRGDEWKTELDAAVRQVEASADPEVCRALEDRSRELLESLRRTVLTAVREYARSWVATVEQAAARHESAELQLHLEAARMAQAEADGTDDVEVALAAAESAAVMATEAGAALSEGLESERRQRIEALRTRAHAAIQRVESAIALWEQPGPPVGLDAVRTAAVAAAEAEDFGAVAAATEQAEANALAAVQELREAALVEPRARADAAVRKAEALAAGFEGEELHLALEAVRGARSEVDLATTAAFAAAAAVKAEWLMPKVEAGLAAARLETAKRKAAAALGRVETLADPDLAPHIEQVRVAARKAEAAATIEAAEAACHEALHAADLAHQAARELERQASLATARIRIAAAADKVAGEDPELVAIVEQAAREAEQTEDPDVAHDAADRADQAADRAAQAAGGRAAERVAEIARQARARIDGSGGAAGAATPEEEAAAEPSPARAKGFGEGAGATTPPGEAGSSFGAPAAEPSPARGRGVAPPPDAPPDVLALYAAVEEHVERLALMAEQAAAADPTRAVELADLASLGLQDLERVIERADAGAAEWRRSQNRAAIQRGREALDRARAAATEADAIRQLPSIRRAVSQVERALEVLLGSVEPAEADWSAALTIAAADRVEELVLDLRHQVDAAHEALTAVEQARIDAEDRAVRASAESVGAEIAAVWTRAAEAARTGDRAAVVAAGKELSGIASRFPAVPRAPARAITPPPAARSQGAPAAPARHPEREPAPAHPWGTPVPAERTTVPSPNTSGTPTPAPRSIPPPPRRTPAASPLDDDPTSVPRSTPPQPPRRAPTASPLADEPTLMKSPPKTAAPRSGPPTSQEDPDRSSASGLRDPTVVGQPPDLPPRPEAPTVVQHRPDAPTVTQPRSDAPTVVHPRPEAPTVVQHRPEAPTVVQHRPEVPSAGTDRTPASALRRAPEGPPGNPRILNSIPAPLERVPPLDQTPGPLPGAESLRVGRPGGAGPTLSPADFAALGLEPEELELDDDEELEAEEAPQIRGGHARDPVIRLVGTDGELDEDESDPDGQKTTVFPRGAGEELEDPDGQMTTVMERETPAALGDDDTTGF